MADKKNPSGVTNKSKAKNIAGQMNETLRSMALELKKLHDNVDAMMKGDKTNPYWNGTDAKVFYEKAIRNMNNNLADYEKAYNRAMAIAVAAETKN